MWCHVHTHSLSLSLSLTISLTRLQSQQPLSPPMMVPSQLSPGPNQQVQGTCTHASHVHNIIIVACKKLMYVQIECKFYMCPQLHVCLLYMQCTLMCTFCCLHVHVHSLLHVYSTGVHVYPIPYKSYMYIYMYMYVNTNLKLQVRSQSLGYIISLTRS